MSIGPRGVREQVLSELPPAWSNSHRTRTYATVVMASYGRSGTGR